MPKRSDIKSILVIGAGPIVIGQACEFDYSGTQACKVLKDEGYTVILINSNPATIMTDPETADHIYIEPITPDCVEKIIKKERPDAILSTVGGQTALNTVLSLHKRGTLKKYNIILLGANPNAIEKAENRHLFNKAMANIGLDVPKNDIVHNMAEAKKALEKIGLPAIIRPSFTLGGSGGGIANNEDEFYEIVKNGLNLSPNTEVLIDESILGWKEYEMEVIRDKNDNAIIVCSIENIDPMGTHTGDSITVAPALTLTDKEYQLMRNASIAVLREIGVETGGSNVQFATHPDTGRLVVIEMNPRVSRSSALASKATGYPIAKVATQLAIGYTLDEINNDFTQCTPASFEPSIDYIVCKIPRFAFEKFPNSKQTLSTQMKSVGETMAIGRSFKESLQKGLRSLETGLSGFDTPLIKELTQNTSLKDKQTLIKKALTNPCPDRILIIAEAMRHKISLKEIQEKTQYDAWYLEQIQELINEEAQLIEHGLPKDKPAFLKLKKQGFSDARLAKLTHQTEENVRKIRHSLNCHPVYKKVDTCAAEFEATSSYLYACYEGNALQNSVCESAPSNKQKIIILGSGPNRIGQGIEFDYACVHAAKAISEEGIESIMINCNPETVSTDYDTSDKLYFDPLTEEDVLEIILTEQKKGHLQGVIVHFGGQTPLKLSKALEKNNIPIIGTEPDKIDLAEDRKRFKDLLHSLDLKQPKNAICHKISDIKKTIKQLNYPVVIRPSNVLGGRAMEILHNDNELNRYLDMNTAFILDGPILIDKFLETAIEIDVDVLSDGTDVFIAGILEHIEEAGIHSGDSACCLPTYSLSKDLVKTIETYSIKLAKALNIKGLMNVQFAIQNNEIYVIEVNPRASRTVPFVAKATGNSIAKIACKLMIGKKLKDFSLKSPYPSHYCVKEVTIPFPRFERTDTCLGPEMKSTGESMGIDSSFEMAFYKAQEAVGNTIPIKGNILISVKDSEKERVLDAVNIFKDQGFSIYATQNTANFLNKHNIPTQHVYKIKEHAINVVTLIEQKKFSLILNISDAETQEDSYDLRRTAVMNQTSYTTTIRSFNAMAKSVKTMARLNNQYHVQSLDELDYKQHKQ
ncbi:MAG: carbamoyl-phosphate synthase large subunit [bacterium]